MPLRLTLTKELEVCKTELKQLRDQRDALLKDRQTMSTKISELEKQPVSRADVASALKQLDEHSQLSSLLHQTEEELAKMKKVVAVEKESEIARLRTQLGQLSEKYQKQEATLKSFSSQKLSGRKAADDEMASEIQRLNESIESLQYVLEKKDNELFEKDKACVELRFDIEQSELEMKRLKSRISDLERQLLLLRDIAGDRAPVAAVVGKPKQSQSKTISELEEVIAAMKKVVEKQQVENESLKRKVDSNPKIAELQKENRSMKLQLLELQKEIQDFREKEARLEDATKQATSFGAKYESLYKALRKEQENATKLNKQNSDLQNEVNHLREEFALVEEREKKLLQRMRTFEAQKAVYEEKIMSLESKAGVDGEKKTATNADTALPTRRSGDRQIPSDNVQDLLNQVASLSKEKRALQSECEKLQARVGSLGPHFFREIEELKRNYQESLHVLKTYESQLHQHSKTYGFDFVPIR